VHTVCIFLLRTYNCPNLATVSVFRVAKMSPLILVFTAVALGLPVLLGVVAMGNNPAATVLRVTVLFLVLIYAWVWLWMRPNRFELSPDSFDVVWPLRRRSIARDNVLHAEMITLAEFKRRYGFSMRIGVGGLWGQFGYSYTREGLVDTYFSTMGPWLLLQVRGGRPLMISPEDPQQAMRALGF
jgi:hypothetical protein